MRCLLSRPCQRDTRSALQPLKLCRRLPRNGHQARRRGPQSKRGYLQSRCLKMHRKNLDIRCLTVPNVRAGLTLLFWATTNLIVAKKSHRFRGDLYANVLLTRGTNISSRAPRSVTLTTARIRTPIVGPSFHPPGGTSTSRLMSSASVVQKRGSRSPANSFKDSETLTSKDIPDGLLEDTVCLMVSKPSVSNRASGSTRLGHDMRQYRSFFQKRTLDL